MDDAQTGCDPNSLSGFLLYSFTPISIQYTIIPPITLSKMIFDAYTTDLTQ